MFDYVDEQDNLEGPQSEQAPTVINAITIPGRTSDRDDGDRVWASMSDQLERKSEFEIEISM